MKREIKFRVWAVASKKMFLPSNEEGWEIITGEIYPKPNTILMQYTGLKDKNGKEIYDGDIIKLENTLNRIIWLDGYACFALIEDGGIKPYTLYEQFSHREPEVIGNIYENSELLSKLLKEEE